MVKTGVNSEKKNDNVVVQYVEKNNKYNYELTDTNVKIVKCEIIPDINGDTRELLYIPGNKAKILM